MGQREVRLMQAMRSKMGKDDELVGGTVEAGSVDTDKMTCSVKTMLIDEPFTDVQLNVLESNVGGVVAIPEDGSHVWMGDIDGWWGVIRTEKIKELRVDVKKLIMTCPEVLINEGKNEGLVIIGKLVGRMNKMEDALTELQERYDNHVHITTATVGATATPGVLQAPVTKTTKQVGKTTKKDLENTKIKH